MMPINRVATLAALVLLLACQLDGRLVSAKNSVRVLDESDPLDIEAIARIMCESKSKRDGQISRLSTVDKLVEFFDQQVSGESHEFNKCKQQHGEALHQLQQALNASQENVCSAEKLALIENFHNKFVLGLESDQVQHHEAAPKLLRLFFMHYAMEVDAVCRRNLAKNVESDLKQKLGDDINDKLFELKDQGSDAHAFKNTLQKFTDLNPAKKCEKVLMVWDLIENSQPSSKQDEVVIDDAIDPQTGAPIKMLVKLRSSGSLNEIRHHCHYNLKPIYSKLVLPIIKLADLGYTNKGQLSKSEADQVKPSEEVKRWIRVTQMCEALLPIKFYEDASLGPKDVAVITKSEAAKLDTAAGEQSVSKPSQVQLVYEPDTNSMASFDRIESVATVDPRKLVKIVKNNASARRHIIGRIVIRLVRKFKSKLMKNLTSGHIFVPKSGAKDEQAAGEEKVDVSEQFNESLERMSEEGIEELDDDAPSTVLRSSSKSGGLMGKLRKHAPAKRLTDVVMRKGESTGTQKIFYVFMIMIVIIIVVALVGFLVG